MAVEASEAPDGPGVTGTGSNAAPTESGGAAVAAEVTEDPTRDTSTHQEPTPGVYSAAGSVRVLHVGSPQVFELPPAFVATVAGRPSLVVSAELAALVDVAVDRHLDRVQTRGGKVAPAVVFLAVAARSLADAHARGRMPKVVPIGEHLLDIGGDDGGRWISTAEYAAEAGIGPRGVLQRIARGKVEAQQVAGRWFIRKEP